ncbi:hypothetical protein PI124_g5584 [Phytophthora idaei]|nr:hypothetical protein PI125_g5014 [Phytophthora idaei]KAG3249770.1 hypothetical protein PI124_g5584 [Phytophthora idaei]
MQTQDSELQGIFAENTASSDLESEANAGAPAAVFKREHRD